jgi:hypothetical protein
MQHSPAKSGARADPKKVLKADEGILAEKAARSEKLSEVLAVEAANEGASATAWKAAEIDAITKEAACNFSEVRSTWHKIPPIRGGHVYSSGFDA